MISIDQRLVGELKPDWTGFFNLPQDRCVCVLCLCVVFSFFFFFLSFPLQQESSPLVIDFRLPLSAASAV